MVITITRGFTRSGTGRRLQSGRKRVSVPLNMEKLNRRESRLRLRSENQLFPDHLILLTVDNGTYSVRDPFRGDQTRHELGSPNQIVARCRDHDATPHAIIGEEYAAAKQEDIEHIVHGECHEDVSQFLRDKELVVQFLAPDSSIEHHQENVGHDLQETAPKLDEVPILIVVIERTDLTEDGIDDHQDARYQHQREDEAPKHEPGGSVSSFVDQIPIGFGRRAVDQHLPLIVEHLDCPRNVKLQQPEPPYPAVQDDKEQTVIDTQCHAERA